MKKKKEKKAEKKAVAAKPAPKKKPFPKKSDSKKSNPSPKKEKKLIKPKKSKKKFHKSKKPSLEKLLAPIQPMRNRDKGLDPKLVSWLSPKRDVDLRLTEIMQSLPTHYVLLLLLNLKNYAAISTELVRILKNQQISGVYFTINKTTEDLVNALIDEEIEVLEVEFIDAITLAAGRGEGTMRNTVYLESPTDLVKMDTEIDDHFTEKEAEKKWFVFDSISTLLIYNHAESVEKFCHSIMGKMHGKKVKAIFLMVNSEKDKPTIESISQFCDKVVELD